MKLCFILVLCCASGQTYTGRGPSKTDQLRSRNHDEDYTEDVGGRMVAGNKSHNERSEHG
jgi:hypothetical protein